MLKLLAAAGVTAVGGYALFEYPPWLNYDQQANDIRSPAVQNATVSAHMGEIVRYASGNPEVPRWIGQLVVAGTKPQQQANTDAKKLRSSPAAVVVASESDGKTAWVRTGQVYERMALTMTALNIKSAFLNQPIEVAAVRGQFQSATGLGAALPQLLARFGYTEAMPRSLRRPIEQVLMQS
jgi:hypothetical protein